MKRLYNSIIEKHLKDYSQMIFLIGPRQVGKTTISKDCQKYASNYVYLNWDYDEDQLLIKALYKFQEKTKAQYAFQVVFDMEYIEKDCFSYRQPVIVPYSTFYHN